MEKIKLFAQGDYEDIELEFKEVDLVGAENIHEVLEQVSDNNIVYAKKNAVVSAKPAVLGEEVDTNPRCEINGKVYTFSETKRVINLL